MEATQDDTSIQVFCETWSSSLLALGPGNMQNLYGGGLPGLGCVSVEYRRRNLLDVGGECRARKHDVPGLQRRDASRGHPSSGLSIHFSRTHRFRLHHSAKLSNLNPLKQSSCKQLVSQPVDQGTCGEPEQGVQRVG